MHPTFGSTPNVTPRFGGAIIRPTNTSLNKTEADAIQFEVQLCGKGHSQVQEDEIIITTPIEAQADDLFTYRMKSPAVKKLTQDLERFLQQKAKQGEGSIDASETTSFFQRLAQILKDGDYRVRSILEEGSGLYYPEEPEDLKNPQDNDNVTMLAPFKNKLVSILEHQGIEPELHHETRKTRRFGLLPQQTNTPVLGFYPTILTEAGMQKLREQVLNAINIPEPPFRIDLGTEHTYYAGPHDDPTKPITVHGLADPSSGQEAQQSESNADIPATAAAEESQAPKDGQPDATEEPKS